MTLFYDDVISLPSPKCFVKMLSYSNLSPLLGIERQFFTILPYYNFLKMARFEFVEIFLLIGSFFEPDFCIRHNLSLLWSI